jgi:putative selenate reductase
MRAGPANLVTALGDGRRAAEAMLRAFGVPAPGSTRTRTLPPEARRQDLAARLQQPRRPAVHLASGRGDFALTTADLTADDARAEAARCLECDLVCDVCVSVCPNRANFSWTTPSRRLALVAILPADEGFTTVPDGELVVLQARQTAHVADFCNHCGNCTTFCPTAGRPFHDKPRFALADASWAQEDDIHRLERVGRDLRLRHRRHGREQTLTRRGSLLIWETADAVVELDAASFGVQKVQFLHRPPRGFGLRPAATLAVLLEGLAAAGGEPWLVS